MPNKTNGYFDVTIGHDGVTGSFFHVVTHPSFGESEEFLVDFGQFQEKQYLARNEVLPIVPAKLKYVFLTHVHADHVGRIPMLYANGYNKMVHTTGLNTKFMEKALKNSAKVITDTAKLKKNKPIYTQQDVDVTMNHVIGYDFNKRINLSKNLSVMFLGNAHLMGACSILFFLKVTQDKTVNLLFCGDYAASNTFFEVPDYPEEVYQLPVIMFQEATYGDSFSTDRNFVLKENVAKAIATKKNILFPAFSLGRYQEIMYLVRTWQEEGIIPSHVRVVLDGVLPLEYNQLYRKNKNLLRPEVKLFTPHNSSIAPKSVLKDVIINDSTQMIVITSSGMGTYGPSAEYIEKTLSLKNWLIHFLGYMSEDSYGRAIKDVAYGDFAVLRDGRLVRKLADVEYTNELSAHAKADENLAYEKRFEVVKFLGINHGERSKAEAYAKYVLMNSNNIRNNDVFVMNSSTTYRFNEYGNFVKPFSNIIQYY